MAAALGWYEDALVKEPAHPWAAASALFCRWKLTGDERYLRELVELAKRDTENARARQLFVQGVSGGLPEPVDATANLLRQFRQEVMEDRDRRAERRNEDGRHELGGTEQFPGLPPGNGVATARPAVACQRQSGARTDPRQPVAEVRYVLWKYEGTDPSPGLLPPAAEVAARIAGLAAAPYDPSGNWAAASHAAEELGPDRVPEILAVMVHPPPVPEGWSALAWLPRVQLAAAQVAAQVDAGWEGSVRREALMSILLGPSDWATEAAIRVLARLGGEYEPIAPDIHEAFQRLADHRPDQGYCCWERALFAHWLELPHLFDREREQLERTLREIDARGSRSGVSERKGVRWSKGSRTASGTDLPVADVGTAPAPPPARA